MSEAASVRARLFVALQHLLPQLLLSRLVGRIARARADWIRVPLIRAFVRSYRPELADAQQPDAAQVRASTPSLPAHCGRTRARRQLVRTASSAPWTVA